VRRYVVAAHDPAYGRALTVTILEPDYSQELRRFVSVEELTSYVLAEEELQKMPLLWQQPVATIQIASQNESGQSAWTVLKVPLDGSNMKGSVAQKGPSSFVSARKSMQMMGKRARDESLLA